MSNSCQRPYIIGICGPSCSGKTTVCKKINDKVTSTGIQNISIISQDSYYMGGSEKTNYDLPQAIDFPLLISHVKKIKNGSNIECPTYDFKTHKRETGTKLIEPTPIVIVEGILIFFVEELRELFDLKIYVDAIKELRFQRRMKRDVEERGRNKEEVEERYFRDVLPSNDHYVEPSKMNADLVLMNNTKHGFVGTKILLPYIENKINELK